jgi:hypothetical protein
MMPFGNAVGEGFNNGSIVVASKVIIIGTQGELLVYSPTQAAGNLIASIAGAATTDSDGNQVLQGVASYQSGFANALIGGAVLFYTGTEAGGWTFQGQLEIDSSGDLLADFNNVVVTGNLTVDGSFTNSGSTGTGLPAGSPTGGPNGGVFAGHTHDFDGHTHQL